MRRARTGCVFAALIAAELITGCARPKLDPPRPGQAVVVLLPDEDGGAGKARVSNAKGGVDLDAARESTIALPNHKPASVRRMSEEDVTRIFGDAITALPPAPVHFTLFFRFESDELTDESRALFPDILKTVKEHTAPDVTVVGHTDTMGTRPANAELGMRRATMIRNLLVDAGLDPSTIEVTSHGEGDLLVRTPDETPEPRNRRVEISVK